MEMSMTLQKITFCLTLLLSCTAFSQDISKTKVALPHFSIILDAQLQCDDTVWKKYPWARRPEDISWKLAFKTL